MNIYFCLLLALILNNVDKAIGCALSGPPPPSTPFVQYQPPSSTKYVRCNVNNAAVCYAVACPTTATQQPASTTFSALKSCNTFSNYVICDDAIKYYCTADIPGCQTARSISTTIYTTLATCTAAIPTDRYKRCLNTAAGTCVISTTSCENTQMTQPSSSFATQSGCTTYTGQVRCYDKASDVYSCVSDIGSYPRCGSSLSQLSNSITSSVCQNYFPGTYVRCVTASAAKCRPAGSITWAESSSQDTSFIQTNPLSDACLSTETLLPSAQTFTRTTCLAYKQFLQCYFWLTNTWQCSSDFACLSTANTGTLKVYDATVTTCTGVTTFTPTSWVRCLAGTTETCRPSEMGCYSVQSETPTPSSRTFTTLAFCDSYPTVADKWLRCKPASSTTPYCIFEACNDGDTRLTGSGQDSLNEFADEATCLAALYQGKVCYDALANGAFAVTAALDSSGLTCPTGQRLIDQWVSGASVSAANDAASTYYKIETNAINHYRCKASNGNPVCRPDMAIGTPTGDCGSGESLLAAVQSEYTTLQACKAALYWAQPCYRALKNLSPYYEISVAFDTSTGCLTGTEIDLSATFQSGSTIAEAESKAKTEGATIYANDLTHYRCKVRDSTTNNFVPVCRPDMDTLQICATDETLLSAGPGSWTTLANCNAALFFAKPCYNPTSTETISGNGKYYTLEPAYDIDGTCATGQLELSPTYLYSAALKPISVAASESLLDSTLHVRCKQTVVGVITVICRPDMLSRVGTDGTNQCASNLGETTFSTQLSGVSSWTGFGTCMLSRYIAKPCYQATTTGPLFYSIVPGYDSSTTGGCATGEADIDVGFDRGSQLQDITYAAEVYTAIASDLKHVRCKVGTAPICRPDMDISTDELDCAGVDSGKLTNPANGFGGLTACNQELYYAKPCYQPATTATVAGKFYSLQPAYDTDGSCASGQLQLSVDYSYIGSTLPVDVSGADNLLESLTHYRCRNMITPYCRPDMTSAVGNTGNCPSTLGETLLTTVIGGVSSWTGLSACNAVRFAAQACYSPSNTEDLTTGYYYSLSRVYDTDATSTCPAGRLSINGFIAGSVKPVSISSATEYLAALKHYRCRNSNVATNFETAVCRPDMTSAVGNADPPNSPQPGKCSHLLGETQLNVNSLSDGQNGQSACISNPTPYFVSCYDSSITSNYITTISTPVAFTPTEIWSCEADYKGCSATAVQLPSSSTDYTSTSLCSAYQSAVKWVRCHRSEGTGITSVICRPADYGCDTANSETMITDFTFGSSPFSTVGNCIGAAPSTKCCCIQSTTRKACGKVLTTGIFGEDTFTITGCECEEGVCGQGWNVATGREGKFYNSETINSEC